MGKREDATNHDNGGGLEGASQSNGGHSLELGRREINLEFLKRFGAITIPGVGRVSLLYRNPLRGKVTVHFTPNEDLVKYLQEESEHGYGEKQRFGESDE